MFIFSFMKGPHSKRSEDRYLVREFDVGVRIGTLNFLGFKFIRDSRVVELFLGLPRYFLRHSVLFLSYCFCIILDGNDHL